MKLFKSSKLTFHTIICCLSLTVLKSGFAIGRGEGGKQLVVIAGPHKTSETSIEEFFYSFARGDNPDYDKEKSLLGWSWPQILGLGSPHQAYDRLVIDSDKPDVQKKIIDALVGHLETSSRGLIMGGDEYDRVGNTIWSHRDAEVAINDVMAATDIKAEDVTIVLLYVHPRVEQWLSIFTHEISEASSSSDNKDFKDAYEEFLCDPETADKRWESLETAMNPLQLASTYTNAGFNVVLIDLDGVRDAGLMIEHVIGCEVLGGTCTDDGWLDNLEFESFTKYRQKDDESEHPFHSLTTGDVKDLEQLFRLRDCNYQHVVDHPNFQLLYEKNLFTSCPKTDLDVMKDLTDTSVLYNAIKAQKNCNVDEVSLETMLGKVPEVNVVNILKYSDNVAPHTANNLNSEDEDSAADEREASLPAMSEASEDVSSMDEDSAVDESEASVTAMSEDKDSSVDLAAAAEDESEEKGLHPAWILQIILTSGIVLWIGFMLHAQSKNKKAARYVQGGLDGIMPSIREDRNRPLSEIM